MTARNEDGAAAAMDALRDRIETLEVKVLGNGRPGLIERMASMERGLATQTWLIRAIVGVTLTTLITVLIKRGA